MPGRFARDRRGLTRAIFRVGWADDRPPRSFTRTIRRLARTGAGVIDGSSPFWMIALLGVAVYCAVRAVRDFRAKHYGWAAAAALSAAVVACVPVEGQKISIVLPIR